MKRILCAVFALCMLFSCMRFSVGAAYTANVTKGTPMVDGVKDAIYEESENVYIGRDSVNKYGSVQNGGESIPYIENGDCYVMWDDQYLYCYLTAYDTDIQPNDRLGLFFLKNGVAWAVMYNPYTQELIVPDNGTSEQYMSFDQSRSVQKSYFADGYYAVEIALRFHTLDAGYAIGFHYLCVNSQGSAENQTLSGNFFNDNIVMSAKQVENTDIYLQMIATDSAFLKNNMLFGFPEGGMAAELKTYYAGSPVVCSPTGTVEGASATVKTGSTVYLSAKPEDKHTVVIMGDINGNGVGESSDLTLLRSLVLKRSETAAYTEATANFHAADINQNGIIDSHDYIMYRRYLLGLLATITPEREPEEYHISGMSVASWCGDVRSNSLNHLLAAVSTDSCSYFGGTQSTGFLGYHLNDFCAGSYTNGSRMNVSDPLYQRLFVNTLYDYTYPVVFISMDKTDTESSNEYVKAISDMVDAVHTYQPTSRVVFLNVFGSGHVYDRVQAMMQAKGEVYWDFSGRGVSEFQNQAATYISGLQMTERPQKPEGATPDADLPYTREGLYFIIYDVEDPTKQQTAKPRVLLIGDSIVHGYYKNVRADLTSKYLVDHIALSLAPSDVNNILRSIKALTDTYEYDAIYFNVGIHQAEYDLTGNNYQAYLKQILQALQAYEPNGQVIFANTTPLTYDTDPGNFDIENNAWISARNTMAATVCAELGIPLVDQYANVIQYKPAKADTHHFADQSVFVRLCRETFAQYIK